MYLLYLVLVQIGLYSISTGILINFIFCNPHVKKIYDMLITYSIEDTQHFILLILLT